MRYLTLFTLLTFPLQALAASASPLQLLPGVTIHWATPEEGRKLLASADTFTHQLSAFDRAVRLKQDKPVSPETFLSFVSEQAQEWGESEVEWFRSALKRIQPSLAHWRLPFPKKILLIKTTGKDEPAPYTRQNAIILPESVVRSGRKPDGLLAHELFHVLSRNADVDYRSALYEVLGFQHCGQIDLPPDLAPRRITNPDSPVYTHFIRVQHEGKSRNVIPILLSKTSRFDTKDAKPFFSYLEQKLMVIEKRSGRWIAANVREQALLLEMDNVEQFYEQIGGRRYSVFQPEEILAGHFTSLVLNLNLPIEQELQSKLDRVLKRQED